MKVMKFGGTSVGSADAVRVVRDIVSKEDNDLIIVVAAMDGVTDQLLEMATMASGGDYSYVTTWESLALRHSTLARELASPEVSMDILCRLDEILEELSNILRGIFLIKDLSRKTRDLVMSYGERLSSLIISGVIRGASLYDSREFIKTAYHFNKNILEMDASAELIKEIFSKRTGIAVVPGYIASDINNGQITNLGRGGSDYTAAIIAAALDASLLEIWTDMDGFMTADPKIISSAYVIEHMTFVEAMELSNFGAKVIYPPTIFPVYHKNIPILVKNIFYPQGSGTYISSDKQSNGKAIKGISSVSDTSLITIRGLGMVGVIGVNYRIFKSLAKANISVFFVSQAASENTTSIGVLHNDADLALEVLSREFEAEIKLGEFDKITLERNLATVAIVGENMRHTPGIAGKLFGTLGSSGINVIACAQGASETNISFVVSQENLRKALNVIHDSFFLSEYQVLNVFISGVGLVGRNLIEQLHLQLPKLMKDNSLQVRVVGVANSRKYYIKREGIDLTKYKELLDNSKCVSTPQIFRDEIIKMNIFNSVFVDCTASEDVASIYQQLLESNVSVVTANKIAASSKYEVYQTLKSTARKRGVKFLFETNVGAGLPIINTINDLINSGDKILKIQAVVSGTLNFIFNEMSEAVPFSKTIMMAKEAGYAEPDPRVDLCGKDVIRKLVILAREAGYKIEQEDVEAELFMPDEFFEGSVEEFWRKVPQLDADFEVRRKELYAKGLRWRFVAELDNGKAKVSLKEVDTMSPFYNLAGSNNVISLTTERYKEYPMQIKGYGAGASVTAAGVFADIISIANIR